MIPHRVTFFVFRFPSFKSGPRTPYAFQPELGLPDRKSGFLDPISDLSEPKSGLSDPTQASQIMNLMQAYQTSNLASHIPNQDSHTPI